MRTIHAAPHLAQLDDAQRENAIHFAYRALVARPSLKGKTEAWHLLIKLVRSRSVAAVARLERERGLERGS